MCGICCILEANHEKACGYNTDRLQRRGPNSSHSSIIDVTEGHRLQMSGHVLHLRGDLTPQPVINEQGDTFLWNGEVLDGIQVEETENDTRLLLNLLEQSTEPKHLLGIIAAVKGPWSFIYWQNKTRKLWFGRDVFGRRSLLWHLPERNDDSFILSSVKIDGMDFNEVPSIGIYCISVPEGHQNESLCIKLYARYGAVWPGTMNKVDIQSMSANIYPDLNKIADITFEIDRELFVSDNTPKLNRNIPNLPVEEVKVEDCGLYLHSILENDDFMSKLTDQLIDVLYKAVKRRVYNQTYLRKKNKDEEPAAKNLEKFHLERDNTRADVVDIVSSDLSDTSLNDLMKGKDFGQCKASHVNTQHVPSEAKVAILFSGGLDSAVITALVDRCLPKDEPVDLINVAFEQQPKLDPKKRKVQSTTETGHARWNVPDRETGYTALEELSKDRTWNFIEVNVSLPELQKVRSESIRNLVYPLTTVLDDSIGSAVWFAARGQGILGNGVHAGKTYTSSAKVILCGMGADEQFAGYSRHRGKYQEHGWLGLIDEVELEVSRISARNLGRDDRVIGDHGKESRFPFLDENVVAFLQQLDIQHKANLNLPRGLGEKLLLRLCATKLGLQKTAVFPKRAIQFGSRIAKMENTKEKGSDKCARLTD